MKKYFNKYIIILISGFLLFIIGTILFNFFLSHKIKHIISDSVFNLTGSPVSIESLTLKYSGYLECKGLESVHTGSKRIFYISKSHAHFNPVQLFSGKLLIKELIIDTIYVDPGQFTRTFSNESANQNTKQRFLKRIKLNTFKVAMGLIDQKTRTDSFKVKLDNLNINLTSELNSNSHRIHLDKLDLNWNSLKIPIRAFNSYSHGQNDSIFIDSVSTMIDKQFIQLHGSSDLKNLTAILEISGDLKQSQLTQKIPKTFIPDSLNYHSKLLFSGSTTDPIVQFELSVPVLETQEKRYALSSSGDYSNKKIEIQSIHLNSPFGQLNGTGKFFLNDSIASDAYFQGKGIILEKFLEHWEALRHISGTVNAESRFSGLLMQPETWQFSARSVISQFKIHHQPVPNLSANLDLKRNKFKVTIKHPLINIHSNWTWLDTSITGDYRLYLTDQLSGTKQPILKNLHGNGTFSFSNNRLHLSTLNLNLNEQSVLSMHAVGGRTPSPIVLDIDSLNLNIIQQINPDIKFTDGKISGKLTLHTLQPEIKGEGIIQGNHIKYVINENIPPLTRGQFQLRISNEKIILDSLSAKLNQGRLFVKGNSVLLANTIQNASMTAELKNIQLKEPGKWEFKIDQARLNYMHDNPLSTLQGTIKLGETKYIDNISTRDIIDLFKNVDKPQKEIAPWIKNTK